MTSNTAVFVDGIWRAVSENRIVYGRLMYMLLFVIQWPNCDYKHLNYYLTTPGVDTTTSKLGSRVHISGTISEEVSPAHHLLK